MNLYGVTYYNVNFKAQEFYRSVNNAVFVAIRTALLNTVTPLEARLKPLIKTQLIESPEVQSLLGGKLAAEFGFVKGREHTYIMPVIDWIVDRIRVFLLPKSGKTLGGFNVELAVFELDNLLQVPSASYFSNDFDITWLKWMFDGSQIINREYKIQYGKYTGHNAKLSRSQQAIMVQSFKGWRVPPEYAGTPKYNWIIETLNLLEPQITFIMEDELSKQIGRL